MSEAHDVGEAGALPATEQPDITDGVGDGERAHRREPSGSAEDAPPPWLLLLPTEEVQPSLLSIFIAIV